MKNLLELNLMLNLLHGHGDDGDVLGEGDGGVEESLLHSS